MEEDFDIEWTAALITGAFFGGILALAGGVGVWLTLSAAAWGAWAAAVAWWSGLVEPVKAEPWLNSDWLDRLQALEDEREAGHP